MQAIKPYEYCATRLERRGSHPPTREAVDQLVEGVLMAESEAVIHSAVSQKCQPLFPSQVYPNCHPEASMEAFTYLLDSLHAIGRPVLSWYSLNHSHSVIEAHPDWKMIPIAGEGIGPVPDNYDGTGVCINSPYRELLPQFAAEIVGRVGFDGLWFDGNTFALGGNAIPGCLCEHCKRRFHDQTGEALPTAVNWQSDTFRRWVNWRYDCLVSLQEAIIAAVHAVKPEATVAFNNYRRKGRRQPWGAAIPMRKLNWDALMSGELDLHVYHGDFQMKMHRAYGCKRGQDAWQAMTDHWNMWVPDVETLPIEQAAVACASAGGLLWMGAGFSPTLNAEPYQAAQEASATLMPFTGGQTVEYAAIWVSQQTQDFGYRETSPQAWDDWHGANELCQHAHVQSSVLFDDHVADGDLLDGHGRPRYPVLLAGDTTCVSVKQARAVRQYVEAGGVLVACANFAALDELGHPHAQPPLNDLLGIASRKKAPGTATLELLDALTHGDRPRWVSCPAAAHVLATPSSDVELLAHVVAHGLESWDNVEGRGLPAPRHPGIWKRRAGSGQVIYLSVNLFASHLRAPTTFQINLFSDLLTADATPAVTLDAPLAVTMNVRERADGSRIVHLHNAPGSVWRYPTLAMNGGQLSEVGPITIRVHDRTIRRAYSALSGTPMAVGESGGTVTVPTLYRNDVIVLR